MDAWSPHGKSFGQHHHHREHPGVGGTLAINAQLPADGHTLVSFPAEVPFTNAYQGKLFNLDEWAVLGGYMPQERVVFEAKTAPFTTFQEMVEYAKKSPVAFGDAGCFWAARVVEAKKHGLQIAVVSHRSGQEASMAIIVPGSTIMPLPE